MQYKGQNLCDFCFEPMGPDGVCHKCGLTHDTYRLNGGLLPPGTNLLGKYIIGRVLGRGGFGATYLAYSSALDKVVALKEYLPLSISYRAKGEEEVSVVSEDTKQVFDKGAKRFYEEARTISKFNKHSNIVSVYEFFYANQTVYYSMEYLQGNDLKNYIARKGGRIQEGEAINILKALCNALLVVHNAQILHRDIAPDNIFICDNGDVKLIDFGAAKQVVNVTQQVHSIILKQGFAPPEQYLAKGKQGPWTDIYAVGTTIYYALTGNIPTDALERYENAEIQFPEDVRISTELKNILKKCLEFKYEDRYQNAMELFSDLDALDIKDILEDPVDSGSKIIKESEEKTVKSSKEQDNLNSTEINSKKILDKKQGLVDKKIFATIIGAAVVLIVCISVLTVDFVIDKRGELDVWSDGGASTGIYEQMEAIPTPEPTPSAETVAPQDAETTVSAEELEDMPKKTAQATKKPKATPKPTQKATATPSPTQSEGITSQDIAAYEERQRRLEEENFETPKPTATPKPTQKATTRPTSTPGGNTDGNTGGNTGGNAKASADRDVNAKGNTSGGGSFTIETSSTVNIK